MRYRHLRIRLLFQRTNLFQRPQKTLRNDLFSLQTTVALHPRDRLLEHLLEVRRDAVQAGTVRDGHQELITWSGRWVRVDGDEIGAVLFVGEDDVIQDEVEEYYVGVYSEGKGTELLEGAVEFFECFWS